jgi:hypothetical protein
MTNPWSDRDFVGTWTDVARERCCARWGAMGRGTGVGQVRPQRLRRENSVSAGQFVADAGGWCHFGEGSAFAATTMKPAELALTCIMVARLPCDSKVAAHPNRYCRSLRRRGFWRWRSTPTCA